MAACSVSPSRIYIVYCDGLFAQGMRSLLECKNAGEVVGMESDVARALAAVRALRPEVLIVQESTDLDRSSGLSMFLRQAAAPRIVALSLDHDYAIVYESCRVPARNPAEFANAIRGGHPQELPQ